MARIIGTGIQEFGKLIEKNLFYVDKTGFIKEWWQSGDEVTLIARPRRFGKTLTMSMVEQFFSIKYAGRGGLFEGLEIWQDEELRKLQGSYPVIYLSFAAVKGKNYQETYSAICRLIAREYQKWSFITDGEYFGELEKDFFMQMAKMQDKNISFSLNQLSEFLFKYYGKKVIILLDEYDTPMQEAYINGYWNELVQFIRGLFNAAFKTNPYLERGILTGITRVSKESIFSDLNNLKVITTTSDKYKTSFGFTEKEVFEALEEFGLQDQKDEVKKWYDGFRFGDCDNIYNPWSITQFLDEKRLAPYWMNTSSNQLVSNLIQKGSPRMKMVLEDLLQGKSFHTTMDEQVVFDQLGRSANAVWSLLVASGYLKVDAWTFNGKRMEYSLKIVNLEVQLMFEQLFIDWFSDDGHFYNEFSDALIQGDKEFMNEYLNDMMFHSLSYYDTGTKYARSKTHENFYHGFVLGLVADLKDRYIITSNRESGQGRYDVMLEPRESHQNAVILEFKVHNPAREETMQDTVDAALQQIIEKGYVAALETRGVAENRIRIYGFAFEGKQVLIGGGNLQEALSAASANMVKETP